MKAISALFSLLVFVIASAAVVADTKGIQDKPAKAAVVETPHQVVQEVTDDLMKVVNGGKVALEKDPKKYFSDVRGIMETAVDFKYIARNVMGAKHWTGASEAQKKQFIEVFTSGLVETYAKGMANFADFEISVQKPLEDIGKKRKVEVIQQFKGPNGVNKVSYTMGKRKSGEWKLINVVLDGVNLGKTLRAQFAQSVSESEGDLDAAIAGWTWQN